ncbi:hypothetical protein, partial [Microvirga antarctica]|uniref:hypothetical protein n=1 Tax=Microvirga antarctica TaxID=2819233 RepID=UPI001B3048A6
MTDPTVERVTDRRSRVRVNGHITNWNFINADASNPTQGHLGLDTIKNLFVLAQLPARSLGDAIGALDADEDDLYRFRWFCRYFVMRNSALLHAARLI